METIGFRPELLRQELAYCNHPDCPLHAHCLRYLSFEAAPPFGASYFIDPRKAQGQGCVYYLEDRTQRCALGFRQAALALRSCDLAPFRESFCLLMGCGRSSYYRYRNGRLLLSLEQQRLVAALFEDFGVKRSELFDSYVDAYLLD